MSIKVLVIPLAIWVTGVASQSQLDVPQATYTRAERLLPWNITELAWNPSTFDSSLRYPVVECLYPIPDGIWAPVRPGDALLNRFTNL